MTGRLPALEPGVWGVVATPFEADGASVDERSLARLVRFLQDAGVAGLTVLGVFGEAAALSAQEREQVLRVVIDSSRLPVVVGITALDTRAAVREIRSAQRVAGDRCRAVMVQVNSAEAEHVIAHVGAIVADTGAAIVLQDYPRASGVVIDVADLRTVVDACPSVIAVKAEAPPTSPAIARVVAGGSPVSVFGGLGGQGLLDELISGSAGAMTGFSFPEALVDTVTAFRAGDVEGAARALMPYLPLINFEQQAGIALAVRKELLRRRGLIEHAAVRAPALPFPVELSAHADRHLALVPRLRGR